MIKQLKNIFAPPEEDIKLAESIKKLYKSHDVTITSNGIGRWSVNVTRKKEKSND